VKVCQFSKFSTKLIFEHLVRERVPIFPNLVFERVIGQDLGQGPHMKSGVYFLYEDDSSKPFHVYISLKRSG